MGNYLNFNSFFILILTISMSLVNSKSKDCLLVFFIEMVLHSSFSSSLPKIARRVIASSKPIIKLLLLVEVSGVFTSLYILTIESSIKLRVFNRNSNRFFAISFLRFSSLFRNQPITIIDTDKIAIHSEVVIFREFILYNKICKYNFNT